jgi:uncharacterized protein
MPFRQKQLNSVLVKPAGPDCNMGCTYCFYLEKDTLFPESKIHRMSEDVLEEMIKQVMSQAGQEVSFAWQGGEPTLMGLAFFEKAVELQQKYGRRQSVGNGFQTNGIVIDKNWIHFFKEYKFLIGLSLDGPEHIHNRYRHLSGGEGSWSQVVDCAKFMLDEGVAVNAITVVTDYSAQFPEEMYSFHKELGLSYMQFIPCVETDPKNPNKAAPFSVSSEKYGEFLCRMFDLWQSDFEKNTPATFIRFFDSVFYSYVGLEPPECTLLKACGVYVVIEHNGDVYSCDFFVEPDWKLGNIMQDKLIYMLNSDRQREFGQLKTSLPESCKKCAWLKYCRGGCMKDRIRDPQDKNLNHFCESFKMFFKHADARFHSLAEEWKSHETLAQEKELQSQSEFLKDKKVGRNDPCPCGSGLKYKKCCGGSG